MARLTVQQLDDLFTKATQSSYSDRDPTRDAARRELRNALTAAYLEADESVVLREQLDIQTRKALVLEQEKRELIAQAEIGGNLVVYAPMFFGPRTEIDFEKIPRGHAVVLTDDPVLGPKVARKQTVS